MAVEQRLWRANNGDVQWTLTVGGAHDIYRLAYALCCAQVDFVEVGRVARARLKRMIGAQAYNGLERYLHCRTPEEQAERDAQIDPRLALIRRAISDPGQFVDRGGLARDGDGALVETKEPYDHNGQYEPLLLWQSRAMVAALDGTGRG